MNYRNIIRLGNGICLAITVLMTAAFAVSCKGGNQKAVEASEPVEMNLMEEAGLLRLYDRGDYYLAEVVNPWDTASVLKRYALVGHGVRPDSLPAGDVVRINIPLRRTVVYSSVHTGVIEELGCDDAIVGVADGEYFNSDPMAGRISRGEVKNVGRSLSPSLEIIAGLSPDAILVSPFENAGHGVIEQSGAAIIECADYMEETPKGRAEWVKFFGILYGSEKGDSIFEEVEERYDVIAARVKDLERKPLVLTEMLTDGYWFVPGGGSYMAHMIQDAGGRYPWGADTSSGSLQLDFSTVYAKAADADVWLIRSYGRDLSLGDIEDVYLLNGQFKAFKEGNVFVANTAVVPFYEEFPFHPELLLEEFVKIFHPEVMGGEKHYFRRAE